MRVARLATASQRLLGLTQTSVKRYSPLTFLRAFYLRLDGALRPVKTAASPSVRTTISLSVISVSAMSPNLSDSSSPFLSRTVPSGNVLT